MFLKHFMQLNLAHFTKLCFLLTAMLLCLVVQPSLSQESKPLDPKAWGSNHINQSVPEYATGDQCLFCHRNTIGPTWARNTHALNVRMREDAPELAALTSANASLGTMSKEIEYFLGSRQHVRFLKKDGYGKFAMLDVRGELSRTADSKAALTVEPSTATSAKWQTSVFADACTGCHATAVDPKTKAFNAFGLDCYTCHGVVPEEHGNNTALVLFAKKRQTEKHVIISTCAQCHLRGGKSATTGLPYPNNFVAGDNLFQDFVVDWQRAADEKLNPGDRHIWRNVRDVAIHDGDQTCVSCHQVHAAEGTGATLRHRRQPRSPICFDCHSQVEGKFKEVKKYVVTNAVCGY